MPPSDFYQNLFLSVKEFYYSGLFCDVRIYARGDPDSSQLKDVACHSLILCSVAPAFKDFLSSCDTDDDFKCIYLPDVTHDAIKTFLNDVYDGLCSEEFLLDVSHELASVLGMLGDNEEFMANESIGCLDDMDGQDSTIETIIVPSIPDPTDVTVLGESSLPVVTFEESTLKELFEKGGQLVIRDASTFGLSFAATSTPDVKPSINKRSALAAGVLAKSAAKRKSDGSQGLSTSSKKPNLSTRVIAGPTKYSSKLSLMKPSFSKLDQMVNGFCKNTGLFVAKTDTFYVMPKVIADPYLQIMIDGNCRQFRMKLPDRKFVCLVAVGVRNEENVVQTVACLNGSWSHQTTFENLINVAKNICGTSLGAILRHPRCAEINRDKISRSSIEHFKEEFRKLSEEDRNTILSENQKYLRDFDTDAPQMEFHHLPQKSNKMEFKLIGDLQQTEIMDYALVSGDDVSNLTIQTFINFNYQKFTVMRLITILCDTISCFLGLNNTEPLASSSILKETFDNYASKTCQLLAVQELNARNREVCIDLIASDATLMPQNKSSRSSTGSGSTSKNTSLTATASTTTASSSAVSCAAGAAGKKKFSCLQQGCNRSFAKESQRNGHMARVHAVEDTTESADGKTCPLCGKNLRGSRELKDHIYYHHQKKECKLCNLAFPGAYLYYYHNSKVHYTVFQCDVCGQEFKGKEKLKVHKINKHLKDHQKPYVCSICGKGYAHKTKLESHQMNMHIRSRPFKCRLEGCDANFNELANRNAHERNVHKFDYKKAMLDLNNTF